MENRKNILEEQKEIVSPLFAAINNDNVFTVPEGYFDELPVRILCRIQEAEHKVPEHYFEELPLQVLGKLQQADVVPEGYFEALPMEILGRINSNMEDLELPSGYFENLSSSVLEMIRAEEQEVDVVSEMQQLSPAIAAIGNQHPFTVPAGYFETNPDEIVDKLTIKPLAPIVKMTTARRVLKYAVAAVVTGLLGVGIYSVAFSNKDADLNPIVMAQAEKIISTNSIDEVFNSLTEDDITNYMSSNGSNINAALVASTINDADLPAVEDYMFDEEALNDFLKEKNISN